MRQFLFCTFPIPSLSILHPSRSYTGYSTPFPHLHYPIYAHLTPALSIVPPPHSTSTPHLHCPVYTHPVPTLPSLHPPRTNTAPSTTIPYLHCPFYTHPTPTLAILHYSLPQGSSPAPVRYITREDRATCGAVQSPGNIATPPPYLPGQEATGSTATPTPGKTPLLNFLHVLLDKFPLTLSGNGGNVFCDR